MKERTLGTKLVFDGRLLKVQVLDVELENGIKSVREVVRHPGAAVILPQLPDGRFVLVRQFRKAIELDTLEVVAGTLKNGENPDDCARRELKEETGYAAQELRRQIVAFPAPGYTDEKLHMYYAKLAPAKGDVAPDEDENVEVEYCSEAEVDSMIRTGRIVDAKTLAAWSLFKCNAAYTVVRES